MDGVIRLGSTAPSYQVAGVHVHVLGGYSDCREGEEVANACVEQVRELLTT
jgi:hypothetical protein